MSDVLVLDSGYRPISRISWQTAFGLIFDGRVEIVEEYANWVVHTVSETFKVPSIIRLLRKVKNFFSKRGVRFNRRNVYLRDCGKCCFCGISLKTEDATYDHVIPRVQGGTTCWENIVIACMSCNRRKADRTPQQAGMRLLRPPAKPKFMPDSKGLPLTWMPSMPLEWKSWLGTAAFWGEELKP